MHVLCSVRFHLPIIFPESFEQTCQRPISWGVGRHARTCVFRSLFSQNKVFDRQEEKAYHKERAIHTKNVPEALLHSLSLLTSRLHKTKQTSVAINHPKTSELRD